MKTKIENRQDVSKLVNAFYDKVRIDEELGPIFNSAVDNWSQHIDKLTDFWEMNLFGGKIYEGNPIAAHNHADAVSGGSITPFLFGTWLNLWFATIDEHFIGENTQILKRRARKMQTILMVSIFENRQKSNM